MLHCSSVNGLSSLMLDPFTTLAEAGFSQRGELITAGEDHWTPELIASLDWMRVAELVRAIAAHSGCELARSLVLEDGSVAFAMIENPTTAYPQRALVKIAAWNEWGANPTQVMNFAREVLTANKARGILIAPGGFTPAASLAAQEHRIETVDASALYAVMQNLSSERSDFFFTIATAGDCKTPTCPVCLQKLVRVESISRAEIPESRVFKESGLIADHVQANRVEVAARAEVTFLHEVKAREIFIAGDATGDFVCEGTVTLLPGGTLNGSVAARSVNVQEGGELLGKFRILSGAPQSFVTEIRRWHWLCRSDRSKPECVRVSFEPHGDHSSARLASSR
ncbi:MAG: polymer-forming cytoskeletal protein [Prosthecobacter sp.]